MESSRHVLAITQHRWRYRLKPVITITHSVNGAHIADYVLTLENGISNLERQSHRLPRLDEGTALVSIALGDRKESSFTMYFERASDLYEKGLLIHLTSNKGEFAFVNGAPSFDHHVYIVSGEREACYLRKLGTSEWLPITDAPPLERFIRREEPPGDLLFNTGWREYEWVVVYADRPSS